MLGLEAIQDSQALRYVPFLSAVWEGIRGSCLRRCPPRGWQEKFGSLEERGLPGASYSQLLMRLARATRLDL